MPDHNEMLRYVPWPFPEGVFPADLGAVVQRTVLEGSMPALLVEHDADGGWSIGDDVNDPNEPDACIATHIWHAIERNSSISDLASLPPGHAARRRWPGDPWSVMRIESDESAPVT
jgi:hypothetical protein